MGAEAVLVAAVVAAVVVGMAAERAPAAAVMLAGVVLLLAAGVVDPAQAFSGFSNPAPLTVAALYVLAKAVETTGALDRVTGGLLDPRAGGDGRRLRAELARMLPPTAGASALLNNTPIVAMLGPRIGGWARRTGRCASRYLMPVSFAAIVGGLVTAIGTSTNLVVSGLLTDAGMAPMGLFEIARVGLPVAVVALAALVVAAPRLVPARPDPAELADDEAPRFTVEMVVDADGPLVGRRVDDAGLRNLRGVYLVEVARRGTTVSPVAPETTLAGGDRLVFAGDAGQVADLQATAGLVAAEQRHFRLAADATDRQLYEAVVTDGSRLTGTTLKEAGFRGRYGGAVIGIRRGGRALRGKLGEVVLAPGDLLLVMSRNGFDDHWRGHGDFVVASPHAESAPKRTERATTVRLLLLALLVAAGTGMVDILTAALVVAVALVALRVISAAEARDAVDLNVVVLIAASFGLGAAISESGLAAAVGAALTAVFGAGGDVALLAGVLLATVALTTVVSNNAAAVIVFPVALVAALDAGLDPRPFAMAVAVGASCGFLTPIGYQTNTMVYGMGDYRFTDFARLGLPLTAAVVAVAVVAIPLGWPLR